MATTDQIFAPREYQVELLEKALKKNIVVCLGTGSGKTFIAVMLIKEMMADIKKPYSEGGKRTFFLAKTVPLVTQQSSVIRECTGLKVGHYTGSMNVDSWNGDVWKEELEKHEVLVMTTQILVNMLDLSFLKLSQVNLLIFDECHHAVGGDPIVQVMKSFARFEKQDHPKVLGLTASVLNGKCKPNQILHRIKKLEITLQSVIETPTNTAMAVLFSTKPEEVFICHKEATSYDTLKYGLMEIITRELKKLPAVDSDKETYITEDDYDEDYDDTAGDDVDFITDEDEDFKFIIGPTIKLGRLLKDLLYAIKMLGLWCANLLAKQTLVELKKAEDDIVGETRPHFITIKDMLEKFIEKLDAYFKKTCPNSEGEAMIKYSSPKVNRLLEILIQYKPKDVQPTPEAVAEAKLLDDIGDCSSEKTTKYCLMVDGFKSIIFVERRSTAWIIDKFLQHLSEVDEKFDFLSAEFVIGHGADPAKVTYMQMKANRQQEKINKFRTAECNVLIATRVVEEGMDIPTCNLVVRFDEPKDFRAYVQSKGRARSRKNSYYVLLCSEDNYSELSANVSLYRNIEDALLTICRERMPPTQEEIDKSYECEIPPYYTRGLEGPSVTMYSAIQLVNRYCSLLPKDRFTRLTPRVKFQKINPKFPALTIEDVDVMDLFDDFDVLIRNDLSAARQNYRCILWLPVNSTIREPIKGDVYDTVKMAKKSVAMKVCIALHKAGQLNDNLLPTTGDHTEFVSQFVNFEEESVPPDNAQPGSTKRRQRYAKQIANQFINNCPLPETSCFLYSVQFKLSKTDAAERINPIYNPENSTEVFGILSRNEIPQIHPFPLNTVHGKLWVEIAQIGCNLNFEEEHLEKIALFHQKLFYDLLDIFPCTMEFNLLEADSSMLIIPLINLGTQETPYFPHWELIENMISHKNLELPSDAKRKTFAFDAEKFTNAVVVPLHGCEKNLFIVEEIYDKFNPTQSFPNEGFKNFVDYYKGRYSTNVMNLTQPLLGAKLANRSTNMLPPVVSRTRKKTQMILGGQILPYKVLLLPELCGVLSIKASLFKQAQYLPSVIYRLNDLLLCRELLSQVQATTDSAERLNLAPFSEMSSVEKNCRKIAIALEPNWERDFQVEECKEQYSYSEKLPTPNVILNALTTRAANDCFNLERLEILGDSFLKYATTLHLFCTFPDADEGKLTSARGKLVSNSYLYHLAKNKGIDKLTKVEIFSPNFQWLPPAFKLLSGVEEKLKEAGMPFHAWHYVKGHDIRNMTSAEIWARVLANIHKDHVGQKAIDSILKLTKDDNVSNCLLNQVIPDKSIADAMEAIAGAYLLHSGSEAALKFLKWLGIPIFSNNCASTSSSNGGTFNLPTTAFVSNRRDLSPAMLAGLDDLEERIGYNFREKSFLLQAITHPSYFKNNVTDCYQRLEFLGDALIDYLITWHLFKDERKFSPGNLTDLRSALVNNITLARLAVKHSFHQCLKAASPSLFEAIRKFLALIERETKTYMLLFDEVDCVDDEEVEVPKALGDIFESIAGAIYLDSGGSLDTVWEVYYRMMEPVIEECCVSPPKAPVREVYETFPDAKFSKAEPLKKDDEKKDGEKEASKFMVAVRISGKTFQGIGKSSKAAKVNAAKCVLRFIKTHPGKLPLAVGNCITMNEEPVLSLDELFLSMEENDG